MIVIGCDIGKNGAFTVFKNGAIVNVTDMPLTKKEVKRKAVYTFIHPKVKYTTGARKGEYKKKLKTPAKYYPQQIDFNKIISFLEQFKNHGEVVFVAESQFAVAHGKAIYQNYGEIRGIARCYCDEVIEITPQQWQKHFKITETDKEKSLELANGLSNIDFKTHDRAESALIGQYYINNKAKEIKNDV